MKTTTILECEGCGKTFKDNQHLIESNDQCQHYSIAEILICVNCGLEDVEHVYCPFHNTKCCPTECHESDCGMIEMGSAFQ